MPNTALHEHENLKSRSDKHRKIRSVEDKGSNSYLEANEMESIYDELDEIKVEAEKLRQECRAKTEQSDNLKRAHIEQLTINQQAKLEIEKLAKELNYKSEEICEIRQMYEELQSDLHRKDLFLQQISSGNEKIRAEYGEKILRLEAENRDLVLALDEASARIQELERKTCASDEEITSLKRLLLVNPEKDEAKKNEAKALTERDEYILKLEEETRITQDQLKWKNEQFSHLEEAHKKLQTHFQVSKVEWQKEKSDLVDELSSLQANLDVQIRVSESLETQLKLCNQALAHEESRRKLLEIEVTEYKSRLENVFLECEVAKLDMEQLTMKRDEDIAELRNLLRKKETLFNDMKYRTAQLEQENSDLVGSTKEIQQAQVNNSATSSSTKRLRKELHGLVQLHIRCAANLKDKESEWNSQTEKLKGDLKFCLSELEGKNKSMTEVYRELEDCKCLLEVKDDEIFALIMVLKSEFYVAYSKLYDAKEKWEICSKKFEERNVSLEQQVEVKNSELQKVHVELKQNCDEITILLAQVEALGSVKQRDNLLVEELKRHKEMLHESNESQRHWKEKFFELENLQREDKRYASDALEIANLDLANKTSEVEKSQLELQKWKADAKILKLSLEEIQQAHKQETDSILVSLKDQDVQIGKLDEKIRLLESAIAAESEAAEMLKKEKDYYMQIAEDRKSCIESLQNGFAQLHNELSEQKAVGLRLLESKQILEQENARLASNVEERDQKIEELKKQVKTLKQNLNSALISFTEKESTLNESLKGANDQKILEIEEKNQIIANLEKEVNGLSKKLEFQGATSIQSKQEALHLEDSLQAKNSEMEMLKNHLEKEGTRFEGLLEELESQKQALLKDLTKSSVFRDDLLGQLESISGRFGLICSADLELMGMLGKILHLSDGLSEQVMSPLTSGELNNTVFSPSIKSVQVNVEERTPLTELNC